MFPYRLHPRPSVSIWIRSTAFDFENYFLNRYNEFNRWLATNILWMDEGRISIIENVNFKNCIHWADETPYDVGPTSLHKAKVSMGFGIGSTFVLGLYFFEQVTSQIRKSIPSEVYSIQNIAELRNSRIKTVKCR